MLFVPTFTVPFNPPVCWGWGIGFGGGVDFAIVFVGGFATGFAMGFGGGAFSTVFATGFAIVDWGLFTFGNELKEGPRFGGTHWGWGGGFAWVC